MGDFGLLPGLVTTLVGDVGVGGSFLTATLLGSCTNCVFLQIILINH